MFIQRGSRGRMVGICRHVAVRQTAGAQGHTAGDGERASRERRDRGDIGEGRKPIALTLKVDQARYEALKALCARTRAGAIKKSCSQRSTRTCAQEKGRGDGSERSAGCAYMSKTHNVRFWKKSGGAARPVVVTRASAETESEPIYMND